MLELNTVQKITTWILPVLFAITIHEAAHAWMANRLGDTTAKALGRLSFNPLRHIDILGTIIIPIAILIFSQFNFIFGWAKPVPLDSSQLKRPRRDISLISIAGPLSNLIMALLWAACLKISTFLPQNNPAALFLMFSAEAGIIINLLLGFLNLIPIPPLDGSRIIGCFLSPRQFIAFQKIEPFGFLILFTCLMTGVLSFILTPLLHWSLLGLSYLFNL